MKKLILFVLIIFTGFISLSLNGSTAEPIKKEISVIDNQAGVMEVHVEAGL